MKKLSIFFALLAGIAVMTGCKKDQDAVTFKAVIDQDSKAYFGTSVRPYWDQDDKLRVMGGGYDDTITCSLTGVTQTVATIEGVESSTNHYYCAIYPVEVAEKIGTPDDDDGTTHAVIYYRPDQVYKWENSRQRVDMPMGAVADDATKTFYFKNLCSILRLNVRNNHGRTIKISRVTVQASGAYVAGSADVTLTTNGNPQVIMDVPNTTEATNVLSLYPENNSGFIKELAAEGTGSTATIDIVVPPFDASSLNIEFELFEADGTTFIGNSDAIINDPPELVINKIVTLSLTTNHNVEHADYAYLESGPEFYAHMHDPNTGLLRQLPAGYTIDNISVNKIDNENNIPPTAKNVKAAHSAINIWAYLVDNGPNKKSLHIDCRVPLIYADKDCSHMFQDLGDVTTINFNNGYGDVPNGFQTEDVTNMSYMFAGCESLTSIADANFNTTNVRTMAHMFEGCSTISNGDNFNLSNFNTHNLQDMEAMFKDCSSLSNLNLSSFSTNRVANMKDLFYGCEAMRTLHIDNFTISSGANIENMFYHLNTGVEIFWEGNKCQIFCTQNLYDAVHATGANTGFDNAYVNFRVDE